MTPASMVIATARGMVQAGLTTGTLGNVSARLGGQRMAITPTRRYAEDLRPTDIVEVRIGADVADDRASQEWRMHAAIYRARVDIDAIVHTHSPYATARSFDSQPLIVNTEERHYLGLRCIRVVPQIDAGTSALADQVVETLCGERAVLLACHGVVGTGRDPRDALAICAAVEHQAIVEHAAAIFAGRTTLSTSREARTT